VEIVRENYIRRDDNIFTLSLEVYSIWMDSVYWGQNPAKDVVNRIIKIQVPQKREHFLTSEGIIRYQGGVISMTEFRQFV
jgi:hypothetical protein